MKVEDVLKKELGTSILKKFGFGGGGCINQGQGYETDTGQIFVKFNSKKEARRMFDGEFASLQAMYDTGCIRVPKPVKVIDNPAGGAMFAAEYIEMHGVGQREATLGTHLANLHKHNWDLRSKGDAKYVSRFGFSTTTCCGYIAQDNTWEDDWVTFYCNKKIQAQIDMTKDDAAKSVWSRLKPNVHKLFEGIEVKPSLLHGDLWSGNIAETDSEPVVFDPACFYGHNEFEFGIATMFGGFGHRFFNAYYKVIPKAPGADDRLKLYQLFHYLNHWNHFGGGYRSSAMSLLKELSRITNS